MAQLSLGALAPRHPVDLVAVALRSVTTVLAYVTCRAGLTLLETAPGNPGKLEPDNAGNYRRSAGDGSVPANASPRGVLVVGLAASGTAGRGRTPAGNGSHVFGLQVRTRTACGEQ